MTNNHNIAKPELTAGDMTRIANLQRGLNSQIDDFIHELGMEIAERKFGIEEGNWEKGEDFLFLDVMPVLTDMIFHGMKRDI